MICIVRGFVFFFYVHTYSVHTGTDKTATAALRDGPLLLVSSTPSLAFDTSILSLHVLRFVSYHLVSESAKSWHHPPSPTTIIIIRFSLTGGAIAAVQCPGVPGSHLCRVFAVVLWLSGTRRLDRGWKRQQGLWHGIFFKFIFPSCFLFLRIQRNSGMQVQFAIFCVLLPNRSIFPITYPLVTSLGKSILALWSRIWFRLATPEWSLGGGVRRWGVPLSLAAPGCLLDGGIIERFSYVHTGMFAGRSHLATCLLQFLETDKPHKIIDRLITWDFGCCTLASIFYLQPESSTLFDIISYI